MFIYLLIFIGSYGEYDFDWQKTAILYSVMLSFTIPWLFQRSFTWIIKYWYIISISSINDSNINGNCMFYKYW